MGGVGLILIARSIHLVSLSSQTQYKGLVTGGNTKLCCRGFILALFQSTIANKIHSEHTQDYKNLFSVCKVIKLQVTVNKIEVLSSF